ncbi:ABC transporter permease [candidate division KSB1 bacterium]
MKNRPPKIAKWILERLLKDVDRINRVDDYEEVYWNILKKEGRFKAVIWYWFEVFGTIPQILTFSIYWSLTMFKNYLKTAMRILRGQRGYTFINIAGLAIGLTCTLLIMFYVQYELSFDKYHKNANEIYRVVMFQKGNKYQGTEWFNSTPGALKVVVTEEFPEVLQSTRALNQSGIIKHNDNIFRETDIRYADPEFLEIFTFPLIYGDRESALKKPFSLLLTEEMSKKYFGNNNPVDSVLNIDNRDYTITGVLKNIPKNSHFTFDFVASFNTLYTIRSNGRSRIESWRNGNNIWNTYILTKKDINIRELEEKVTGLLKKYRNSDTENKFHLQPLTSIHLHSKTNFDAPNISDIRYIYLFSAIAFLIILIACMNYMNLSTARSVKRAKEIGVRKVVGAYRGNLIKQFFGESVLFVFIALIISIVFVNLLIPGFSKFIERDLNYYMLLNGWILFGLIGILISVGLLSGSYPALLLSSFKPIDIIRGTLKSGSSRSSWFRNILVLIQYVISVILIVCSMGIYNQLEFIRTANIGFRKDQIVYGIAGGSIRNNFQPFKEEIAKNPNITDVYALGEIPISISSNNYANWEGKKEDEGFLCYFGNVDYNFIDFFKVEIFKGRNFSKDYSTDVSEAWILNEAAVKVIGWEDPVGKKFGFRRPDPEGRVIGVVRDFHNTSLHIEVEPMALYLNNPRRQSPYFAVRLKSENISGTIDFLEEKFKEFSPDYPFRYYFLDERVDRMYSSEKKLGQIFLYFTVIAIFISCLGLFGLVSFTAEQKTKEIGIRKVLGASVSRIVYILSKEFIRWVILAVVIAFPIAWYAMQKWLENFAYKTTIGIGVFITTFLIAICISFISVAYKSIKAAAANPVDSLKNE